jgi:hypothetical protein
VAQAGDLLLYRPHSLMGHLIALKSWSRWSHVEVVVGPGVVVAARYDGGVRYYLATYEHLGMVLRPNPAKLNLAEGLFWFDGHARGQAYDLWGLFRFFTLGRPSMTRQFCSELATRIYRRSGFPTLFHRQDADLVPPGWFATLTDADDFRIEWSDEVEAVR